LTLVVSSPHRGLSQITPSLPVQRRDGPMHKLLQDEWWYSLLSLSSAILFPSSYSIHPQNCTYLLWFDANFGAPTNQSLTTTGYFVCLNLRKCGWLKINIATDFCGHAFHSMKQQLFDK
jgi:hypothetical protein